MLRRQKGFAQTRGHKIKKGSHLEGQKALTCMEEADRHGFRLELFKNGHQLSLFDRFCSLIGEHPGDAYTCHGRVDRGFRGIH